VTIQQINPPNPPEGVEKLVSVVWPSFPKAGIQQIQFVKDILDPGFQHRGVTTKKQFFHSFPLRKGGERMKKSPSL
jgi:hypothetical protein